MDFVLGILLIGLFDPLIWMKSMSSLGLRGSKRQCVLSFFLCYLLVVGKGYTATYVGNGVMSNVFTIALIVDLFLTTIVLFKGSNREKALHTCIYFCIIFVTEFMIMGIFLKCKHYSWETLTGNGIANIVCSGIAKGLQAVICYFVFHQKKSLKFFYHNKEVTSMLIVLCIFVANIAFGQISNQQNKYVTVLFGISGVLFLWYIIRSLFTLKEKEKNIVYLKKEVNYSLEQKDIVSNMGQFKHNFSMNIFLLKNLCYHEKYDEFGKYVNKVFEGIEKAEILFDHPNLMIRILMSSLMQKAKEMRIPLTIRVQVREFGMENEEICAVLKNLVMNGLEAAAKVPPNIAHVSLQVLNMQTGYEIRCINDCLGTVDFERTTKQDKENHGYGSAIVNQIVKKYHGTIKRSYIKEEENLGTVVVYIKIYYNMKIK